VTAQRTMGGSMDPAQGSWQGASRAAWMPRNEENEGDDVIAMSQGYVTLGGVCIALTSYSLCIHFLYPGSSKEDPWI
jgi:hypothetical protein